MSILGLNSSLIADAIAAGAEVSNATTATQAAASLRQPPVEGSLMDYMAVSAEELTFQFSEVVEAKETGLEKRLEREHEVVQESANLKVEQIQAVIKLMEGKDGYDILRNQARSFASLYQMNFEAAMRQLDMRNLSQEKKYVLLKMALEAMGTGEGSQKAKDSLAKLIHQQSNPFNTQEKALVANAITAHKTVDAPQNDSFFQAVMIQPTVKGLWDLISEKSTGNLLEAMQKIQQSWAGSHETVLESVGVMVIVQKIMQIIQSMHADSERFLLQLGIQDIFMGDMLQKNTRLFIDLAQSSMPSTLIDKTFDTVKNAKRRCRRCTLMQRINCKDCANRAKECNCTSTVICKCTDFRVYTLSMLHWHARQWPLDVWASSDAKYLVLDQLLKKQGAIGGLVAKRMMG